MRWSSPQRTCISLSGILFCEFLFAASLFGAHRPAKTDFADAIYYNGDILTGNALRSAEPERVTAFAIRGGLVLAVGSAAEAPRLRGAHTEVIDLHGAFVMPGFNDAHTHLAGDGQQKLAIDLTGVTSLREMQQRIAAAAKTVPAGSWLQGGGWDETRWPSKTLPSRRDLDAVAGGHPALFSRVDGHIAVADSRALELAGITPATLAPRGGTIDHDASGRPTGIVRETAVNSIAGKIPAPSPQLRRRALDFAMREAAAQGVTSAQDYSSWNDFLVMEQMERDGALPIRICEWLTFLDPLPVLERQRAHHPSNDPMLHTGMLKGFLDGSLGSRTAALKAPYSDDPGNYGIPRFDRITLNRMTIERARAGFQIGFHAIGDRAAGMALDAFAAAEAAVPESAESRFRIEHAQVVDADDLERFRRLRVLASVQPSHLLTDMRWAQDRIGPERARFSYLWKSFVDQGTPLAFGTDVPVESIRPFRGLYAAVTRQNEAGTESYFPSQKLSIGEALYAYTQGSAFAEHMEASKGRLIPGQFADFVVLDRDPTKAIPKEILATQVLLTVVGGRTVYRSKAFPRTPAASSAH